MTSLGDLARLKTEIASLNDELHPVDRGDEIRHIHNLIVTNILECGDAHLLGKAIKILNEKATLIRSVKFKVVDEVMFVIIRRNIDDKIVGLCKEASSKRNRY
jgi:hypothetical protein